MSFHEMRSLTHLLEAAGRDFVISENVGKIVLTGLLSMVPTFEGRYAVTVMLGLGMPVLFAYFFALICSSLPVPLILLLLRPVLNWFYTLPIAPVRKFAAWLEARAEKKRTRMLNVRADSMQGRLRSRVSAETFELLGLYIFVAVPLPGTGVWTGALIASLFRMDRKKAGLTILLGNVTACLITTLIACGAKAVI